MGTIEEKRLRCAVYTRFSDEMQSRRSCEDQERECRSYAERQGWEVVAVERDEAVRAGAVAGKEGQRRLQAAAHTFDILLIEEVSRFSRDFMEGIAQIYEWTKLGVRFADTKAGIFNTDEGPDQVRLAYGLSSSQQETQRLGQRSKRGVKGQVLRRFSGGGQPAYGYQRDPVFSETELDKDGRKKRTGVRCKIDPVTAPVVLRIFELYDAGHTKHGIAKILNDEGIRTKRAGGQRLGRPNSGTWAAASVKRILGNPIYIGKRIWNVSSRKGKRLSKGKRQQQPNQPEEWVTVDDFAEPIVPEDLWERVQRRLKADAAQYRQKRTANENKQYLLSGLIRCANCNANFVIGLHLKNTRFYGCSFRRRGNAVCMNKTRVPQAALEARVRHVIDSITKDPRQLEALVADHNRRISTTNESQLAVVRALETQRAKAEAECRNIVTAIAMATGEPKRLVAELEKRESEIAELTEKIIDAEALVQPLLLPKPRAVEDYVTGSASVFDDDQARARQFLERILEGIWVYADGSVVLRFHQASLFGPVRDCRIDPNAEVPLDLKGPRRYHERMMAETHELLSEGGWDRVSIREGAGGFPFYVLKGSGMTQKKALASPTGFEPVSPP